MNEFVKELKHFVQQYRWRHVRTETHGGCETCGYGGTDVQVLDEDWDHFERELDAFCESFKKDSD